jgi:precorrin-2 dehydrogenase/sirohydrochlorin ferrochelatase
MRIMLVDIDLGDKTVLIVGGGRVGARKATKFLAAGAKVIVASKDFTARLKRLSSGNRVQLVHVDLQEAPQEIRNLASKADFVIAATNHSGLNRRIAQEARKKGTHVNVVDEPALGDFTMPVTSRIGDIDIAISTGGKSPAMSNLLRRRIEGIIREEDILMVRLQAYARELAKTHMPNQQSRKRVLYTILEDTRIRRLLNSGNFQDAKSLAKRIIKGC